MKIKTFIKRRWKRLLVILAVIAAVLFFVFRNRNQEVKTATVQKGTVAQELILSGAVTAKNYARLSFETAGKITYVGVSEGDKVLRGRLISKLDTTVLNSSYQTALANLRSAEATVANVHDQVKNHSADESFAQKDLRTAAEVNKDKAYEAVIAAKRNLDGAILSAPFNGIITYLAHPYSSVYTTPTTVEAEIIDPSTIYFLVLADQTEVTDVKVGQKVTVVLDSFSEETYQGVVDYISYAPQAGESGTSYTVRVKFQGVELINSPFKIGMTGDAKFILEEKADALYVPSTYVNSDTTGKYLVVDGRGKRLYIQTGLESEDYTEVIGDLSEGLTIYD